MLKSPATMTGTVGPCRAWSLRTAARTQTALFLFAGTSLFWSWPASRCVEHTHILRSNELNLRFPPRSFHARFTRPNPPCSSPLSRSSTHVNAMQLPANISDLLTLD